MNPVSKFKQNPRKHEQNGQFWTERTIWAERLFCGTTLFPARILEDERKTVLVQGNE
jgi:hypothetical protein